VAKSQSVRRSRSQTPRGHENRTRYARCAKRLQQVFNDLGGSYRVVSRMTGVAKSTLHRLFEPHPEPGVAEGPTLMTLDRLLRASGASADWILGRNVPKGVHERSVLGALEAELERVVDERVAEQLGHINPAFVAAVRHMSGADMVTRFANEVRGKVEPTLANYREFVQGKAPARATGFGERIAFNAIRPRGKPLAEGGALAEAIARVSRGKEYRSELEGLPSPD
jgi:hypothetical protein